MVALSSESSRGGAVVPKFQVALRRNRTTVLRCPTSPLHTMKRLLSALVIAAVIYVAWDLFGGSMPGSLREAAQQATSSLRGRAPGAEDVDFVAEYDAKTGRFGITSRHDPGLDVHVTREDLTMYMKTRHADLPQALVLYRRADVGSIEQQAEFEADVLRILTRSNVRGRFAEP